MTGSRPAPTVRTAVVIVHGMGEQLPLETLNRFVRTALPEVGGERRYFSRPAHVTTSYEARRLLAFRQRDAGGGLVHGQVDFFEYHWSYLMTGNRVTDVLPTLGRVLLRRPRTVPAGLRGVWWVGWAVLLLLAAVLVAGFAIARAHSEGAVAAVLAALLGGGAVGSVLLGVLRWLGARVVANSFVDVVRYLDRSPRSYEVRRSIRTGMVELLRGLHDGRYARVVVAAHSLGAYIAYDGITSLWAECAELDEPRLSAATTAELRRLEQAAATLAGHPPAELDPDQQAELAEYRSRQFALWQAGRRDGHPWLVTDFISIGTPMYFADLLYTRNRDEFDRLVDRGELPQDPPLSNTRTVESTRHPAGEPRYAWPVRGPRSRLGSGTPFAVVRWTNLYFPVLRGWRGDWFGGPLRPLFGRGILDLPVTGNRPGRLAPGLAHARYFSYPEDRDPDGIAVVLQRALALQLHDELLPAGSRAVREAPQGV